MYKISPNEINSQEFKKVIRGYDTVEVDTFLEMVAVEYNSLVAAKEKLENRVKELESGMEIEIVDPQEADVKIPPIPPRTAISIDEMNGSEAGQILEDAKKEAREITVKARRELQQLQGDIIILKERKAKFVRILKKELRSQIELLKVIEADLSGSAAVMDRKKRPGAIPEKQAGESVEQKDDKSANTLFRQKRQVTEPEKPAVKPETAPEPETPETPVLKSGVEDMDESPKRMKIQDGFNLIDNILDEENRPEPDEEMDDN